MAAYPTLMNGDNAKMMMETLEMLPAELLRALNMDIISPDDMQGWLIAEGALYLTLVGTVYFAILGSTLLLKEEDDGTIAFLAVKPVSRFRIVLAKVLAGFTNILIFNIAIAIICLIGLSIIADSVNFKQLLLTTLNPMLLHAFVMMLAFNVALLFKKTSRAMMCGIGIVFVMYVLPVLSTLIKQLDFLKYTSPFYYTDARTIIESVKIIPWHALLLLVLTAVMFGTLQYFYSKKELS